MRIRLIRNTVVNGQARETGDVVETDQATAIYLISMGKAVPDRSAENEKATVTARRKWRIGKAVLDRSAENEKATVTARRKRGKGGAAAVHGGQPRPD